MLPHSEKRTLRQVKGHLKLALAKLSTLDYEALHPRNALAVHFAVACTKGALRLVRRTLSGDY
jgi:hypothetical protein